MRSQQTSDLGRVTVRAPAAAEAEWDTVVLFEESDCVAHLPELERQIRFAEAGALSPSTPLDSKVAVELCGSTLLVAVGSEAQHSTLLENLRKSFPPAKDMTGPASGALFRIDWEGQRVVIMGDSLRLGPIPTELIASVAEEMRAAVSHYLETGLPEVAASGLRFPALKPHPWHNGI